MHGFWGGRTSARAYAVHFKVPGQRWNGIQERASGCLTDGSMSLIPDIVAAMFGDLGLGEIRGLESINHPEQHRHCHGRLPQALRPAPPRTRTDTTADPRRRARARRRAAHIMTREALGRSVQHEHQDKQHVLELEHWVPRGACESCHQVWRGSGSTRPRTSRLLLATLSPTILWPTESSVPSPAQRGVDVAAHSGGTKNQCLVDAYPSYCFSRVRRRRRLEVIDTAGVGMRAAPTSRNRSWMQHIHVGRIEMLICDFESTNRTSRFYIHIKYSLP
ncbi:hypothetical protein C8R47DRAFT_170821 [Mycena vitilis]|nr:hypothetical protein C8R47DRAFT_170821 [Mycena vitilis]